MITYSKMVLHTCTTCGFQTSKKSTMINHENAKIPCVRIPSRSGNESLQCSKCNVTYKNSLVLMRHESRCCGVHPLQCPDCKVFFNNATSKSRHIKKPCKLHKAVEHSPSEGKVTEGIKKEIAETDIIKTIAKTNKGKGKNTLEKKRAHHSCKDCDQQASYNFPGLPRKYCALCRLPGMEDVVVKRCKEQSCTRVASYKCNISGASFCVDHVPKHDDVTKTRNLPTCDWTDCDKKPMYGACSGATARLCSLHKFEGMVDVVTRRCMECDKPPTYGYPGKKQTHCLTHRKHTQIRFSSRRCNYSLTCTHLATHGRDGQLQERCGLHAETDMINLLEKTCKSCDLVGLTDVNGLCETCDPKVFE
jgi:uncharacterized C2H2 Zn-finger protein